MSLAPAGRQRTPSPGEVLLCLGLVLLSWSGMFAGDPSYAAASTSASWQLASTHVDDLTDSTLTLTTTAPIDVAALRFRLPDGVTGRLAVVSTVGLGPGSLHGSGPERTYVLDQDAVVAAGQPVGLTIGGWQNPAEAGFEHVSDVALVPHAGPAPPATTTNNLLITATIDATVSAGDGSAGDTATLTWKLRIPPAVPAYGLISLDVPAELVGAPDSASVSGLGAGAFARTSSGLDYRLTTRQTIGSGLDVTVVATWSHRPPAARDIPLGIAGGDGAGTVWATGAVRTPGGLEPGSCGAFRADGWVTTENAQPGDTGWHISSVPTDAPRGFAGTTSAQCGDTVALHVSSQRPYQLLAYRMGWYDGDGARLVWQSDERPAVTQPSQTTDATTNMVEAPWSVTDQVAIGTGWVPGDYLFELVDTAGEASYIPLTIRDDESTSALLVENSVLTWQAYNQWGGYSLYIGPDGQSADRSRIVSFNRPYGQSGYHFLGDGQFFANDYAFVRYAEKRGLDLSYWTDLDLDRDPALLARHKTLVLLRHDEYWTQRMRDGVTAARDNGMNLAFLGANDMYWRARLEPDSAGDLRHMVVYRYENEDPEPTPADATTTYRSSPINNPEQRLIGIEYDCLQVDAPMVITDSTSWVFANTGLTDGSQLPDLVYQESDRYFDGTGGPPVEVLAHSPLACPAHNEAQTFSDMSYYDASSGGGVFAVGTMGWEPGLDDTDTSRPYPASERAIIQQITDNVLAVFAQGPAGNTHPAVPNTGTSAAATTGAAAQPQTFDGNANAREASASATSAG